jgi:general nucleoside transport system permease protein
MTALTLTAERFQTPTVTRRIGQLGILIGLVACWLALPPFRTRTTLWPVLVGLVAIAAGIWVISRDEKRLGWGSVVAGAFGIVGGYFAIRSSVTNLDLVFAWSALIAATMRFATPLAFASIGGMFSERSGVTNIGLEGMMLMGAFWGIWGSDKTGHWWLGLLIAMLAGGLMAFVHALWAIHLRADQIVGGTAINFLALGITGYAFIDIYGSNGTPSLSDSESIPDVNLHLGGIPWAGNFLDGAFGQMNLMTWLVLILLVASAIVLFRTPVGLRLRAVGEHPRAAETVGISVYRVRYFAVTSSGMLSALGGAYLSIGFVHSFNQNMTAGRGFIALAAVIFGKWRPGGAFAAALLFGFSSALAQRLGTVPSWESYGVLFQALPYVLTLIAVAGVIGRSIPPAAVGRPYVKQ